MPRPPPRIRNSGVLPALLIEREALEMDNFAMQAP